MMPGGIQPVELAIEHVGDPGQRMPVVGIASGESPGHSSHRQSWRDLRVVIDIGIIVEIEKPVPEGFAKRGQNGPCQEDANARRKARAQIWRNKRKGAALRQRLRIYSKLRVA